MNLVENLTLKREHPPEWLSGNIPCMNPKTVTLHGNDGGGQGMAVPLALLVADCVMARSMLLMCEGPERHVIIAGVKMEILNLYVKLLSTGKMLMKEDPRYDFCFI